MEKTMVLAKTAEKPNYESEILRIIRGNTSPKAMLNQLEDYHGSDIADVIEQLSEQERKKVFRICPAEMLAEAFAHLEEEKAGECLKEISPRKAGEIVSEMETDDAVEILHTIGREKRELILDALDEDIKKEIRLIASFDEDEIGSRMTTNCIILHEGLTVKDAMNELVRQAEENDNMTTLFVVDETDCFYGAIALKDLIVARSGVPLESLIATSFPYVYANETIDDCIEQLKDYSEDLIPVLDNQNKLLGVITAQSLIDVVDEEMGEDYAKLAGLTAEEDLNEPLKQSVKKRLPWLFALLLLGLLVSVVVGAFEKVVAQLTLIPVADIGYVGKRGDPVPGGHHPGADGREPYVPEQAAAGGQGNACGLFQRSDPGRAVVRHGGAVHHAVQAQDHAVLLCGFRLHRRFADPRHADLQRRRHAHSAVLQEDQGRPGSCVRSAHHHGERPGGSCHLLRHELDFTAERFETGVRYTCLYRKCGTLGRRYPVCFFTSAFFVKVLHENRFS